MQTEVKRREIQGREVKRHAWMFIGGCSSPLAQWVVWSSPAISHDGATRHPPVALGRCSEYPGLRGGDGIGTSVLHCAVGMGSGGRASIQGWDREEYPGLRSGDGIGKSIPDCAVGMGSGRVSWIHPLPGHPLPGHPLPACFVTVRFFPSSDSFHPQIPSIVSFMPQADVSVVCSEVRGCRMQWSIRVRFVQ